MKHRLFLFLILFILGLAACSPAAGTEPAAEVLSSSITKPTAETVADQPSADTTQPEESAGQMTPDELAIRPVSNRWALAYGQLTMNDNCTTIGNIAVNRVDERFQVTITPYVDEEAVCTPVIRTEEVLIPLFIEPLTVSNFLAEVNGRTAEVNLLASDNELVIRDTVKVTAAEIETVTVLNGSDNNVILTVNGHETQACAVIKESSLIRQGNVWHIVLTEQADMAIDCAVGPLPYERHIVFDDLAMGEDYTVEINGETIEFMVPVEDGGPAADPQNEETIIAIAEPFRLAFNQMAVIEESGETVTFVAEQDSRCPADATCVWSGSLIVTLDVVTADGGLQSVQLSLDDPTITEQAQLPSGLQIKLLDDGTARLDKDDGDRLLTLVVER